MCTYCTFKGDIGPQGVSGVKGEKGKAGDSGIDGCRCKGQKVCLSVCLLSVHIEIFKIILNMN